MGGANTLTSRVVTRMPATSPPPTSVAARLSGMSSSSQAPQPSHRKAPWSSVRPHDGQPNVALSVPPPAIGSANTEAYWSEA